MSAAVVRICASHGASLSLQCEEEAGEAFVAWLTSPRGKRALRCCTSVLSATWNYFQALRKWDDVLSQSSSSDSEPSPRLAVAVGEQ